MIRVLLVDDQSLLRMGFRLILEAEPDIEAVGEAGDGATGVSMASALRPDVVLMDVRMPGMDGIEATRRICAISSVKVLVLTMFDLDEYVYDALRAGASGFLLKDIRRDELADAVRVVAAGKSLLAPEVTRRLIEDLVRTHDLVAEPKVLFDIFGLFVAVLVGVELLKILRHLLLAHEVNTALVVQTTLIALCNKIITVNLSEASWTMLVAVAALILSLTAAIYALRHARL